MHPEKRVHLEALQRHLARLDRRLARLDGLSRRYGWARLALFLGVVAAAFVVYQAAGPGWGVALGGLAAFIGVARYHRRVDEGIRRYRIWRQIKAAHLARMTLDWDALPQKNVIRPEPAHPFEADLDVAGPRSLHHLMDTAASRGGSQRLWTWLRRPLLDAARLAERQALVQELARLPSFRDRLALNGTLALGDPEAPWDGEHLRAWLEGHTRRRSLRPLLALLGSLAAVNLTLFVLFLTRGLPPYWLLTLLVYVGIYLFSYRGIRHLFDEAFHLEKALRGFRPVAAFLEGYRYGPHRRVAAVCAPFREAEERPSRLLRRVARLAAAASSQKSELWLVVLNTLGPWDLFFAHRLDRLKAALSVHLPVWLDAWYDLEALAALATFADLNPGYAFPEVISWGNPEDASVFEAEALGHPLLPDARRVSNDFAVEALGDVAIITGSNMSGKSTFLRTVGLALCLALAGGPVCADRCRTRPFRLFTSINVVDSIGDGLSHFYAEVRRLKRLLQALDAEDPAPLFFLIDEIFRGTNNRERLQGSRALVRALAGSHATGLVSTHDLELTRLADAIGGVRNAHFREDVADGRLTFDYRLRPGPCPTTNALKIMQMEGLPVEPTVLPPVD